MPSARLALAWLAALGAVLTTPRAFAQAGTASGRQAAAYACAPRLQLRHPHACEAHGPGGRLAEFAQQGLLPERPLPVQPIDPALAYLPYLYLRVGDAGAPLYPSLEEALAGINILRSIEPGYVFLSWIDRFEGEAGIVYQIDAGVFIRGDDVSRISTPTFHGLAFEADPARPFGWILGTAQPAFSPGGRPIPDRYLYRYQIVQIYDRAEVGDLEWTMVGPDEWVEGRLLAQVDPDPAPPPGVPADRWISVNLYEQTLAVYEGGQLRYATLVSSGLRGWWTRPGAFQVYAKLERDHMAGAFEVDRSDYYYLEDVPWVLYYDEARALHGAYWHNGFGYPRSHGCLNLAPTDAHWLYEWAEEGTWVYVWDASGETPTDPAAYGEGGA